MHPSSVATQVYHRASVRQNVTPATSLVLPDQLRPADQHQWQVSSHSHHHNLQSSLVWCLSSPRSSQQRLAQWLVSLNIVATLRWVDVRLSAEYDSAVAALCGCPLLLVWCKHTVTVTECNGIISLWQLQLADSPAATGGSDKLHPTSIL